jgi:hypothetical protein
MEILSTRVPVRASPKSVRSRRVFRAALGITAAVLAAAACDPQRATVPDLDPARLAACLATADTLGVQDVAALQFDWADPLPARYHSAAVLHRELIAADGRAMVAFKEPGSQRMTGGFREAVSASSIRAGLRTACSYGAEIHAYLASTGWAYVHIDPTAALLLRGEASIDMIEPVTRYQTQGMFVR